MIDPKTELRFLSSDHRLKLNALLDASHSWKTLASVLVRPGKPLEQLVSSQTMRILEEQKQIAGRSPTQALIDYWSTTGKRNQRPTISTLIENLRKCDLIRVAEFVEKEILGSEINSDSAAMKLPSSLLRFPFSDILAWTNNFDTTHVSAGGHKIGEGAFGAVFKTNRDINNKTLAIKVLNEDFKEQFLNEVDIMTRIDHINILPLIAVSLQESCLCLVMEFMQRGSLLVCLSNNNDVLTVRNRLNIAVGAARGLNHLHTFLSKPFVHRDVKSDNILLDNNLTPKIADFGLARIGSSASGMTTTRHVTQNIIGTSVYMAPEAFRGDVSIKIDTFAYGVVLLELLTGLKPFDESRDEPDILSHIEEMIEFEFGDFDQFLESAKLVNILDVRIQDWPLDIAKDLLVLSRAATEQRKKNRPTISEVLDTLEKLDEVYKDLK